MGRLDLELGCVRGVAKLRKLEAERAALSVCIEAWRSRAIGGLMGSCTDPIGSTLEKRLIDSTDMCDLMGITTPAGLMREAAAEIARLRSALSSVHWRVSRSDTAFDDITAAVLAEVCEQACPDLRALRPNVEANRLATAQEKA